MDRWEFVFDFVNYVDVVLMLFVIQGSCEVSSEHALVSSMHITTLYSTQVTSTSWASDFL
jgi:hypothetical protein